MEKLDKVIAGLGQCHHKFWCRDCDVCPYSGTGDECVKYLMEDALEVLTEYRSCLTGCGIRQYGMKNK